MLTEPHTALIALLASLVWACFGVIVWLRTWENNRTAELATASEMLDVHIMTYRELMNNAELDDLGRDAIVRLSELLLNPERLRPLLKELSQSPRQPMHDGRSEFVSAIPPSLRPTFLSFVESGLAATVNRWPDMARAWRDIGVRMIVAPDRRNTLLSALGTALARVGEPTQKLAHT